MRRAFLIAAVVAPILAGAGCHKNIVTGRCDCTNDPSNGIMPATANPYSVIGGNTVNSSPSMAPMTAPVMPEKMPAPIVEKPKN